LEAIEECCCGLDVHQATVVACLLAGAAERRPRKETRTFGTTTSELEELRTWLLAKGCTHVGMESTGVYWMPLDRSVNVSVHSAADALSRAAAQQFCELARTSIRSRGRFTVVLSGGSTPRRGYEFLAARPLRDGDERGVPPDPDRAAAALEERRGRHVKDRYGRLAPDAEAAAVQMSRNAFTERFGTIHEGR